MHFTVATQQCSFAKDCQLLYQTHESHAAQNQAILTSCCPSRMQEEPRLSHLLRSAAVLHGAHTAPGAAWRDRATCSCLQTQCLRHPHYAPAAGSPSSAARRSATPSAPRSRARRPCPSPNNNAEADGMASIISHELSESVTDPLINAWCAPGTPAHGRPILLLTNRPGHAVPFLLAACPFARSVKCLIDSPAPHACYGLQVQCSGVRERGSLRVRSLLHAPHDFAPECCAVKEESVAQQAMRPRAALAACTSAECAWCRVARLTLFRCMAGGHSGTRCTPRATTRVWPT